MPAKHIVLQYIMTFVAVGDVISCTRLFAKKRKKYQMPFRINIFVTRRAYIPVHIVIVDLRLPSQSISRHCSGDGRSNGSPGGSGNTFPNSCHHFSRPCGMAVLIAFTVWTTRSNRHAARTLSKKLWWATADDREGRGTKTFL